jgi:hypothetical protein
VGGLADGGRAFPPNVPGAAEACPGGAWVGGARRRGGALPDDHDPAAAIAHRALEAKLLDLAHALAQEGVGPGLIDRVVEAAAGIYLAGYRDGARHAVAEIAPEAAQHGLQLWLAPGLEAPPSAP